MNDTCRPASRLKPHFDRQIYSQVNRLPISLLAFSSLFFLKKKQLSQLDARCPKQSVYRASFAHIINVNVNINITITVDIDIKINIAISGSTVCSQFSNLHTDAAISTSRHG